MSELSLWTLSLGIDAGGLALLGISYRDCRGGESSLESILTTCIVSREPFESSPYCNKPVSEHHTLGRSFLTESLTLADNSSIIIRNSLATT